MRTRIDAIGAFTQLGYHLDLSMRTCCSAIMIRLCFAVATSVLPDILLMGEWLSTGNASFLGDTCERMESCVLSPTKLTEAKMAHYHPENSRGWIVASIFDGTLSSRRVSRTLKKMVADPEAKGHSDIGVQNLMYMLSVSLRPRRVLEIGTHIGMAAVIIGHALKANRYGKLITLEPAPHYFSISARYVKAARLSDFVQIWPAFSYDPNCKSRLREEMPFELIFIDGAHDYQAAAHDIAFCAELLCDNGVMVLHDVGAISHSLDPTGRGGVRQALWDFCEDNPEFRAIFLEFPVWLNNTGTAIVAKEQLEPPVFGRLAKVMAAE